MCVRTCVCAPVHVHVHACMYVHVHEHMCVRARVCTCVCGGGKPSFTGGSWSLCALACCLEDQPQRQCVSSAICPPGHTQEADFSSYREEVINTLQLSAFSSGYLNPRMGPSV